MSQNNTITMTLGEVTYNCTPVNPQPEQPKLEPVQDPNVLHMTVRPLKGQKYYCIVHLGVMEYTWKNDTADDIIFNSHNCYTKENAYIAVSILQAKVELQNIATELNAGRVIDWLDWRQDKWTLGYDYQQKTICDTQSKHCQDANISCLERLHEVALERMGENKLKLALNIWQVIFLTTVM